jgi:hypothetical protein
MKLPSLIAAASLSLFGGAVVRADDATTPVDYTQRNAPFAPAATITPPKSDLSRDDAVQDKRVETVTVDKKSAAIGDRRAAISVEETRDKNVREKNSSRPEAVGQSTNQFNHREAAITTGGDTKRPPTVAKYQDSLTAASASNMARFPALDQATTAKINRFIFRKNSPEPSAKTTPPLTGDASVTHAGGLPDDLSAIASATAEASAKSGSPVQK